MHTGYRAIAAAIAVLCSTGLATSALAAGGLPTGRYYCRYYDQSTMGAVTVTSATAYRYSNGKRGVYRRSGSTLTFVSGPLKGVYEHARFTQKPTETYFHLFDGASYGHSYTDATCIRER
jgi:hypothetical protein